LKNNCFLISNRQGSNYIQMLSILQLDKKKKEHHLFLIIKKQKEKNMSETFTTGVQRSH
jgi:hypothetical protein